MIGIRDPEIAFAFDIECEDILLKWETERQDDRDRTQIEAMTGQAVSNALGNKPPAKTNARRW